MLTPAEAWLATVSECKGHLHESRPCIVCGDTRAQSPKRTVFSHYVSTWLTSLTVFLSSSFITVCRNMLEATVDMQPETPLGKFHTSTAPPRHS